LHKQIQELIILYSPPPMNWELLALYIRGKRYFLSLLSFT